MRDLGLDPCQQQRSSCQPLGQCLLLLPKGRLLHTRVVEVAVTEPVISFAPWQTLEMLSVFAVAWNELFYYYCFRGCARTEIKFKMSMWEERRGQPLVKRDSADCRSAGHTGSVLVVLFYHFVPPLIQLFCFHVSPHLQYWSHGWWHAYKIIKPTHTHIWRWFELPKSPFLFFN